MAFTLRINVDDLHAATRRAEAVLRRVPKEVFGFVEAGADILQQTDIYENHTGNLRASTQAINVNDDWDAWHFNLTMGESYASYVNDLGFSRIDEVAGAGGVVRSAIWNHLTNDVPRRLSGEGI